MQRSVGPIIPANWRRLALLTVAGVLAVIAAWWAIVAFLDQLERGSVARDFLEYRSFAGHFIETGTGTCQTRSEVGMRYQPPPNSPGRFAIHRQFSISSSRSPSCLRFSGGLSPWQLSPPRW